MTLYHVTRYTLSSGKLKTIESNHPPESGWVYVPSLSASLKLGSDIFTSEQQAREHVVTKMIPKKQESLTKQLAKLEKLKRSFE